MADYRIPCAYCGDLRYPEDMDTYDGNNLKYKGKKMCLGCFDDLEDEEHAKKHEE